MSYTHEDRNQCGIISVLGGHTAGIIVFIAADLPPVEIVSGRVAEHRPHDTLRPSVAFAEWVNEVVVVVMVGKALRKSDEIHAFEHAVAFELALRPCHAHPDIGGRQEELRPLNILADFHGPDMAGPCVNVLKQ